MLTWEQRRAGKVDGYMIGWCPDIVVSILLSWFESTCLLRGKVHSNWKTHSDLSALWCDE